MLIPEDDSVTIDTKICTGDAGNGVVLRNYSRILSLGY